MAATHLSENHTTGSGNNGCGQRAETFGNGPVASASFNRPADVAVDVAGNILIADAFNNMIRKIVIR